MAFPLSPVNNQIHLNNGVTYQFNTTSNAWLKTNKITTLEIMTELERNAITPSENHIIKQSDGYYVYISGNWTKLGTSSETTGVTDVLTSYNRTVILDAFDNSNPATLSGNVTGLGVTTSNSNTSATGYISDNKIHIPPQYSSSISYLNNQPGYIFYGGTGANGMRLTGLPMSSIGITVMMPLYIPSTTSVYSSPWRMSFSDGTNDSDIGFTFISPNTIEQFHLMSNSNTPQYAAKTNSFYISTIVVTPTQTTIYRNKTLFAQFSYTRNNFTSNTNMFIGFGRWSNQFLTGYIGKTFIYYGALNQTAINSQIDAMSTGYNYIFS